MRPPRPVPAPRVVVLATGGTIASRFDDAGSAAARDGGARLISDVDFPMALEAIDVVRTNSYLLAPKQIRQIVEAIREQVARPEVVGVVVTHGTDTIEETAFVAALCIDSDKPIVFTGAQRTPDSPDPDGSRNLGDALLVAAAAASRARGVLVVFDGTILSAIGVRKVHTTDLSAFAPVNVPALGRVDGEDIRYAQPPLPHTLAPLDLTESFDDTRVDVVVLHPGFDVAILEALRAQRPGAIILGAMGAGNGGPGVLPWVADTVSQGMFVGLSTRVPNGPVMPIYGAGGGASLVAAGAVSLGSVPLFQARMLVAMLASIRPDSLSERVQEAVEALTRAADPALESPGGRASQ